MATKSTKKTSKKTKTSVRSSKANATKRVTSKKVDQSKTKATSSGQYNKLRRWHFMIAGFELVQATVILVLSQSYKLPVTTNFLTKDSLASSADGTVFVPATHTLFDANLAWLVSGFLIVAAICHLLAATKLRRNYEAGLAAGVNKSRWLQYCFSVSLMMVVIAMVVGVYDLSTLLLIAASSVVMHLACLVIEKNAKISKQPARVSKFIGDLAGVMPWLVFLLYVIGANKYGDGLQNSVYILLGSMLLFFAILGFTIMKQLKGNGRWADNVYAEKVYLTVGVLAEAALAWQVFASLLRP